MPTDQSGNDAAAGPLGVSRRDAGGRDAPPRTGAIGPITPKVTGFDSSSQSIRLDLDRDRSLDQIVSMDVMQLRVPSYSVMDGGHSMLLTHVLRHSSSALRWRNAWNEMATVEPGSVLINQGRRDSLIEISPLSPDDQCDCVRVVWRSGAAAELSLRFEAHDFPFCNSPQACVRVILGSFGYRVAHASPVPNLSMLDIDIAPFSELDIPVPSGQSALVILTSGSIESDGIRVEPWHTVAFDGSGNLARLRTSTGASILWFGVPRRVRHG